MNTPAACAPNSKSVLIVDGSEPLRKMLTELLRSMGYASASAADGRDATAILRREDFDLVLSGFQMPRMSGWDLLTWMRENRPETPVVMMSGSADDVRFRNAVEPFVDGLLGKPFTPEELGACLRQALARPSLTHMAR